MEVRETLRAQMQAYYRLGRLGSLQRGLLEVGRERVAGSDDVEGQQCYENGIDRNASQRTPRGFRLSRREIVVIS